MSKLMMTPGPTTLKENVRSAMAREITNPDLDLDFYEFYKGICEKLKLLLKTKNRTLVLDGEGILGLEAACASLIEPSDKVLCIENGIFGEGFGDFAKLYGGEVTYLHLDRRAGIDFKEVEKFLKDNHDFKVATLVHCETPSGITNDIKNVCKLLNEYNILTVVDTVASTFGEELYVDDYKIDIALGGSQKCLSAPPGLTFLSISERAFEVMNNRKEPIRSFYANLTIWNNWYENKWFPYTQPISALNAFDEALNNVIEDKEIIDRHKRNAEAVRKAVNAAGLELLSRDCHSNTVTTILVPDSISFSDIFNKMRNEHNILIAGGFDFLKDKIIRIGHMGENSDEEKLYKTLEALDVVFKELGVKLKADLHKVFRNKN
ncbi:aspartate aminotransferase [Clostridium cavendishii DSM 21758]|uniref:Aspartate aminotransferase n=1 Tax=Clostridium cavendishii DSM 21758 TaxID=1121302 RepID=A0A1M6AD59_9CLOT|nr:alanine--glyoxylate aminotransferase family protein [Clostridium cavendishii]SHI34425.1 aspartate aminotransferase [Clostridium cavendishii DSM 21758]